VEDWALEREKHDNEYAANDYLYNKRNYQYQNDNYRSGFT